MTTVLAAGTFDVLHEGHRFFLHEAKRQGDKLVVVVARDEHIIEFKRIAPHHSEQERIAAVRKAGIADEVLLGKRGSIFNILSEIRPDIICLGYDQNVSEETLKEELRKRNLQATVLRIGAHKPEQYKSSLIRDAMRPKG